MKKKILVIGRDPQTLLGVISMLNENDFEAYGESIDERALDALNQDSFDGVLLGGGVGPESREILIPAFKKSNPSIKIVSAHPWQALNALRMAFTE